jgi:hypothetical protein
VRSKRLRLPHLVALWCSFAFAAGTPSKATAQDQDKNQDKGIVILSDSPLPETYPHAHYSFILQAHGGSSSLHWHLIGGSTLPPGLKLEDSGHLYGEPQRVGEFHFTILATDGDARDTVQKEFTLHVTEAITVIWKSTAHVNGTRIEGSVAVTNTTADDVDLTFVVEAVAENGRATAIGYQHFPLPRATQNMELPFGESLPSGTYLVNVDVIGEVAVRNQIYRQRLQMPHRLQVIVGP